MKKKLLSCLIANIVSMAMFYVIYKFGINYEHENIVSKYGILCFLVVAGYIMTSDYKFLKGTEV